MSFVSTRTRSQLYRAAGWRCQQCNWLSPVRGPLGRPVHKGERYLTLDHVVPRCVGGPNARWNFAVLCNRCNGRKADAFWPHLLPKGHRDEFRQWRRRHPQAAASLSRPHASALPAAA